MGDTSRAGRSQMRRLELFGTKGVVTRCRDFTAHALADWGWTTTAREDDRARVADVLLLVSEVVTNACLHAGGPRELVLRHEDGHLRVEVADASPVAPARRSRAPSLPGGHGLMVLDRLAGDWGSIPLGTGKVVWLEVALPSRAERSHSAGYRHPPESLRDARGPFDRPAR
ncbi:ATP-binding protein [Streptomyces sp. BPTC-684]|uniref:ATP-binding protein n=1 Tax=Streptomyces sp. BPTC-684 TaxID=3043734 RepID=UPI0024B23F88|nr:ATP-binding protein [Streptomyces sp. BPTC-684]WHM40419.1 ATP-binding protein [Streptomyces sp. BPTC-684]